MKDRAPDMGSIRERVRAAFPDPKTAPLPESYTTAVEALRACAANYSPELYAAAKAALQRSDESTEPCPALFDWRPTLGRSGTKN